MTKAEIIDAVYDHVGGFSKKEAAEIVEAVFDTMKEVLADGTKIKISGFGNFQVRPKKERTGRNPQTGEPIPIEARRVLTFKPSQVLKAELNPHMAAKGPKGEERPPNGSHDPVSRSFPSAPDRSSPSPDGPADGASSDRAASDRGPGPVSAVVPSSDDASSSTGS